ncbi:MAG TPA: hypothetical protein VLD67_19240 [Vicinamibacterales bacterium]|nr:hypothetical protein [Vicinamibacterales bacterium]
MKRARAWRRSLALGLVSLFVPAVSAGGERYALIVAGASGGAAYAAQYAGWTAELHGILLERMKLDRARVTVLSDAQDPEAMATAANVRRVFEAVREKSTRDDLFFIVLIGHGTFDGVDAKFNLVGPDLESGQWAELLGSVQAQAVIVNTTSASFPFVERLAGERRIVITATDSAAQRFDTVFPGYFIQALRDDGADIDKNGRVSIWEAFVAATRSVRLHYQQRGQLATERALLDDNGDGVGREAAGAGEDGSAASHTYLEDPVAGAPPTDEALLALLQKRASLELEVEELKVRRTFLPPEEYQREFERVMIELARVAREIRERNRS